MGDCMVFYCLLAILINMCKLIVNFNVFFVRIGAVFSVETCYSININ